MSRIFGVKVRAPVELSSRLLAGIYETWCRTMRWDVSGLASVYGLRDAGTLFVAALWHDELFPVTYLRTGFKLVTVVSQSRDGEILARTLERLDLATARGSSSRGGLKALLTARRMMQRQGLHGAVLTVDGPRGPRHKAKDGAVYLASVMQAPIVPVRAFCTRVKRFNSWDRFQLPLPGGTCRIVSGEPYTVEGELTPERLAEERTRLEQAMAAVEPAESATQGRGA